MVTQIASFVVRGRPVPKGRPRFDRRSGRTYTPQRTKDYEKKVRGEALHGARWIRTGERSLEKRPDPWPIPDRCLRARPRRRGVAAPDCGCGWCSSTFSVVLRVFLADRRKVDVDNIAKAILDGANGVLWLDDSQVTDLKVSSDMSRKNPRVEVEVSRYEPDQLALSLAREEGSLFEGYVLCADCEGVGSFEVELPSGKKKTVRCGTCAGRGRFAA